ncbi:MAG: hypothetical protein E7317_10510 [Clostridiales bacterium]|nr:hypothetical protein [Clostridiales bacterium]
MLELSFVKLSPTQNTTVLVRSPVPRERHAEVAAKLLGHLGIGGEQVGFIEEPSSPRACARLQMMGGEFCGNATMSLGALMAEEGGLPEGMCESFLFEVSGCDGEVGCTVVRRKDRYEGIVDMPLPCTITDCGLDADGHSIKATMVSFDGITHLIVPSGQMTLEDVGQHIRAWNTSISADALGVILADEAANAIWPTVFVPASDTVVRERGCGSGTLAYGCCMAHRQGAGGTWSVRQPGGTIEVTVGLRDGAITSAQIRGDVRILARGTAYVETD